MPRFGVETYVDSITGLYDRLLAAKGSPPSLKLGTSVTLGILYHMPFWQTADGALWEAEGSFARYVDSLAPYFDTVILSVPVFDTPPASGSRVRSANVGAGAAAVLSRARGSSIRCCRVMRSRLRAWVAQCDVIHLRVPSPAAIFAFRLARALRKPVFLLVVGDYEALLPHLGYRGVKKALFGAYVAFEEWALRYMTTRALTFANGAALRDKHERQGARVIETKTTTLSAADMSTRTDTCTGPRDPAADRQPHRSAQGPARRCRRWWRRSSAAGLDVTLRHRRADRSG